MNFGVREVIERRFGRIDQPVAQAKSAVISFRWFDRRFLRFVPEPPSPPVGCFVQRDPVDLALKLRVAISQQVADVRRPRYQGLLVRIENAINAFMVPATAGLVSAVLIFGLLLGFFALPGQLQASSGDVPLMLYTAPQLEQTMFGTSLGSVGDDSVVIEAYIDANGRVEDYRILSQPDDALTMMPEVKKLLIFTTFRPALSMGRPTSGRAVISFSKVSVKG